MLLLITDCVYDELIRQVLLGVQEEYTIAKKKNTTKMLRTVVNVARQRPMMMAKANMQMLRPVRFYSQGLSKDVVQKRVVDVIKAFDKTSASADITEDTLFHKDLKLDSLDTVELLVAIEEEFDVEFPDKVADELKSVKETVDYILSNPDAN
ncbi:ACP1 [Nakaseomyces glabratus]|nr:ACP1 [Nakaseomyces glabratus]UCS24781.1 ACP1 [Nakaseomyces glabratus]UCS30011.1 ACP1 [Nakaseomyces glabratus]UCS35239.1 ACP1 [Nakaseomyces glabratus]